MLECNYHHGRGASWHCPDCSTDYCVRCIPGGDGNFRPGEPRCPLCAASLQWRGKGEAPEPFWRRGPDFLRYAVQPPLLALAVVTAFFQALHGLLADLFALFFQALVLCYGLLIVTALARDDWQPPTLQEAMHQGGLLVRLIALIILVFAVSGALIAAAPAAGILLLVLVTIAFPASVMILASTGSLRSALNAVLWIRLMTTIGVRYIVLWLALLTVSAAPDVMVRLFPGAWELEAFHFLLGMVSVLSTLVVFALMGYVLQERAGELGFLEQMERGEDLLAEEFQRRQALGLSTIYSREGRHSEARRALEKALAVAPGDRELNRQLHRVLRLMEADKALIRHSDTFLEHLAQQGQGALAADILRETRSRVPDYVPSDPALCHRLAEALAAVGHWREAARLLVNLHRRAPSYPDLGDAYVLLGQAFLEGLERIDGARRVLEFLRRKKPDSLTTDSGERLVRLMERVTNTTA